VRNAIIPPVPLVSRWKPPDLEQEVKEDAVDFWAEPAAIEMVRGRANYHAR